MCAGTQIWCSIKNQTCFTAQFQRARLFGWQKEGHIDVAEIDHIQHPTACRQHFAWLGNPILHASVTRGFQFAVIDICGNAPFSGLCRFDASLRLNDIGACRLYSGFRSRNLSFCRFQRSSGALSGGAVVIQLLRRNCASERERV